MSRSRVLRFAATVLLLLTCCRRQEASRLSPDQELRSKLTGTWVFEPKYANGGDQRITTAVALDGSYVTTISLPTRKIGPRIIWQEGTWRVEDGFLIQAVTKDSQTNASVPYTSRLRIVRMDERELELENQEKIAGIVYPTNAIILRRQTK